MTDDPLVRDPVGYRVTADGRVLISRGGRVVVIVAGQRAVRLCARLEQTASVPDQQQILARATGNYRRGNERGA